MSPQMSLFAPDPSAGPRLYLGTHHPGWLSHAGVPLCVSRRTLAPMKRLPRAAASWALDSGGFTELQMFGQWTISAVEYIGMVRRFQAEIGRLDWAAPQDWMCEIPVINGLVRRKRGNRPSSINTSTWRAWAVTAGPQLAQAVAEADLLGDAAEVVFHGTGLSVEEHQRRTIENFLELRARAPDVPWAPVLQGWSLWDYWRHIEDYQRAGVNLRDEPIVGVGSVCRRQGTSEAGMIFSSLQAEGLRLHGFGVKTLGLRSFGHCVASVDFLSWSDYWRRRPPLPGHDQPGPGRRKGHKNCANCKEAALLSLADAQASADFNRSRRAT